MAAEDKLVTAVVMVVECSETGGICSLEAGRVVVMHVWRSASWAWSTSLWRRFRGAHWQPTCHAGDPVVQIVFVVLLLLLALVAYLVRPASSSWSSRR